MEGELNISQTVAVGTIDILDGRIRGVGITLAFATILIDANHLEGEITHFDMLAQTVAGGAITRISSSFA